MRNFTILVLFTIAIHSYAQSRFDDFMANFTPAEELADSMFTTPFVFGEWLDMDRFGRYLPTADDGSEYAWHKGGWRVRQGDSMLVVAFGYRDAGDCEECRNRMLAENVVRECFLLTYTGKGRPIDVARIGMEGDCYFLRVRDVTANPVSVTVEQATVMDGKAYFFYEDLGCSVTRFKFLMGDGGRITFAQEGASWEETRPQEGSTPQNTTFDAFLRLFTRVDSPSTGMGADSLTFTRGTQGELDYMSVSSFVPDTLDCQCFPRALSWIPCGCIEYADRYVCFMETVCEYPMEEHGDRYVNRLRLTYSKEGKLTDARVVSSKILDADP